MAFLPEIKVIQIGQEGTIRVHTEQVAEVLRVLRREGIHSEITACPGVHIGVQTTLNHVHERVSHRVVFGAAKSEMLEDVRLSGVVVRGCPEKNGEDVVHVGRVQVEPSRPCSLMLQSESLDVKVCNLVNGSDFKAMDLVSNIDVVGHSILASGDIFTDLVGLAPRRHQLSRSCLLLLLWQS